MITYKQFMINEMAEEISMFQKVRAAIKSSRSKEALLIAIQLFLDYQMRYGDKELYEKIHRVKEVLEIAEDAKEAYQKLKKRLIIVYNWYNDNRRRAPKDIQESASL